MGASAAEAQLPEAREGVVYYVDNQQQGASDESPALGRESSLHSIQAALQRARTDILAGRAARIVIANGTYRESLTVNFSDQEPASGAPLVIEAAEPGKVTISGSDVYTDWQPLETGVYAHPWPFKWGFAENPWTKWNVVMGPLALRGEIVFVKGERLRQVLNDDDLRALPMTFLVDEDKEQIRLHIGDTVNIADALIEVAIRGHLLHVQGGKNVTIRGIRFQHAGKPRRSIAVLLHGEGFTIDQCAFDYNNDIGLRMQAHDVHIIKSTFNNNGFHGLNTVQTSLFTIDESEISFNNWRGAMGRFFTWDPSNKQVGARDHVWNKVRVVGNKGSGLWFDGIDGKDPFSNVRVTIKDSIFIDNGKTAIDIESNSGPFYIKNNVFCENNDLYGSIYERPIHLPAVLIWDSRHVYIQSNTFYKNYSSSIGINYDDKRVFTDDVRITHNILMQLEASHYALFVPNNYKNRRLFIDHNRYIGPPSLHAFLLIDKQNPPEQRTLDFVEWQQQTGQDQKSTWEEHAPGQLPTACTLTPAH